jgi:DHA2 family multidrug resistance protein
MDRRDLYRGLAVAALCARLRHADGLQFVRGLAVGAFIPAAPGFILRSLAPQWWIWGIAAYSFHFVFSGSIGVAVEGWYSETGHWEWIFWQNTALTPVMLLLPAVAMPRRPVDRELLRRTDWVGIAYAGVGFGLLYAGLDQDNRLDGFNSGVVTGLLLAGGLLVVAFLVHEACAEYPLIPLRVLVQLNVAVPALLFSIYGFGTAATSFVLPDYLTRIQGLRALQISDALNWIALPQFVLVPLVVLLLKRIDARLLLMFGFSMIDGRQLVRQRAHSRLGQRGLPGLAADRGCRSRLCDHCADHLRPRQHHAAAGGGDRRDDPDRPVAGQ